MSTKASVLKLLHLGEIWKCGKKRGGLLPIFGCGSWQEIPGRDRACVAIEITVSRHGSQVGCATTVS